MKKEIEEKKYICTECKGDATVAMVKFNNLITGQNYYKRGERLCMSCHKKRIGISFF